jgi:hypothetical protein
LKDQFFDGINSADGERELVNPNSGMVGLNPTVFYEGTPYYSTSCTRFLFEQIRNADFYVGTPGEATFHAPATKEEYTTVINNLINKYGLSLVLNMIYDASVNA